jgi:predicted ATP-grasp superfamily ATP-dependent carboligase
MQDEVVQLVACNRQTLAPTYQLVTQDWEIVQWANDKRLTYRMAQEIGVPYPATCYPCDENELVTIGVPFPAIIKPAISVHLQYKKHLKALPATSYEELLMQYRRAVESIHPDEVMIQEVIPGDGRTQYSIAAFCQDGQILTSMTARRTRQYPIDYGLGSSFVEALAIPALFELAEKLLCYMKVSGMVEVEFKYDCRDQLYKLLDINLRPWGWHTLCIACGLDFPYMQYLATIGPTETPTTTVPRYDHHWVRLLTDIPAGLQEIRAGITTPRAYLRSLTGKTVFSVFDWRDPLPFFGDLLVAFSRALRSLMHKIS